MSKDDNGFETTQEWAISAETLNGLWWRVAAWIVLWQVLSHVGGLIEGVWHWKLVTLLGA